MPIIILCEACMIYETSNHELFILIRSKSLFEGLVDNSDWQFHSIFNSSEQMKQENVYCSSGACTNLAAASIITGDFTSVLVHWMIFTNFHANKLCKSPVSQTHSFHVSVDFPATSERLASAGQIHSRKIVLLMS